MAEQQFYYRYEGVQYGNFCRDGDYLGAGDVSLILDKYPVIRETEQGVWIDIGRPKWIRTNALKHWACHSQEAALLSFIARTEKHIAIIEARRERLNKFLPLAYNMLPHDPFQDDIAEIAPF
jgi:hypothetical protein